MPPVPEVGQAPDFDAALAALPVLASLADCPQEPEWHREGDVWTHTQMVCTELVADPAWQALSAERREELYWAGLLHDVGKPPRTRVEDGRITSRGHARTGTMISRELMWRLGVDPARRERVCGLVRWHMTPGFLLEQADPTRRVITAAVTTRLDDLALLARADTRGRIAPGTVEALERVDLFAAYAEETGCIDRPYPFASDHSRFLYFRREGRDPAYEAWDDTRCGVTVMVGLPGAGKDSWLRRYAPGLPVVSLDDIRDELGARRRRGDQGRVVQQAKEQARGYLRDGVSVAWNATNLSRMIRDQVTGLAADYNARVRIVCVDPPAERVYRQNRERSRQVPDDAISGLVGRFEMPDLSEAHSVIHVVS